jgi:hypothetical protein
MLNIAKHAAVAAAGIGLAAMAAPPQAAACFVPAAYGCAGAAFGMYRPVIHRVYRPVAAFGMYRPVIHRSVYRYAHRPAHRAAYGYAYAVPHYRVYRPVAFRIFRPVTYAWAAPRHRYRSYGAAYGASMPAYGAYKPVRRVYAFVPRYRPVFRSAFACGC